MFTKLFGPTTAFWRKIGDALLWQLAWRTELDLGMMEEMRPSMLRSAERNDEKFVRPTRVTLSSNRLIIDVLFILRLVASYIAWVDRQNRAESRTLNFSICPSNKWKFSLLGISGHERLLFVLIPQEQLKKSLIYKIVTVMLPYYAQMKH